MKYFTDERRNLALEILDRYHSELLQNGGFNTDMFRVELRATWQSGWSGFKAIIVEMSEDDEFFLVAAYFMEHSGPLGPAGEFWAALAALYEVARFRGPQHNIRREEFWRRELSIARN